MRAVHQNTHQGLLEAQIHHIFPQHNTIKNARREAAIKNPETGGYLEVDLWLPDINLCFEFQDDYHYKSVWYSHIPLGEVQQKDNIKRNTLLERGHTFIGVPYWWDGKINSLRSTINFYRPDLHLAHGNAITPNPPSVKNIGHKLMLASFPDSSVTDFISPKNTWWVGEKWDGIRCCWNSAQKQLYSRQYMNIDLQQEVSDLFGHLVLDGEIWCGRGFFSESQNFILSPFEKLNSAFLRLMCFDEASLHLQNSPFETRYTTILSHVSSEHPTVIIAPRFLGESETILLDALNLVVDGGGEGLILRKTHSHYIPGRSKYLLKIKATYSDQEALVVEVENDGSLLLQLPNGFQFVVPRRDFLGHQRAVKGDIVTFSFDFSKRSLYPSVQSSDDYLGGVPANPVVHRIRYDISWEDVLHNSSHPVRWFANEDFQFFTTSAHKMWDKHDLQLSQPLDKHQRISYYYQQFPEMLPTYDPSKKISDVSDTTQNWNLLRKRREYFDNFAAFKGADPLNVLFWYSVTMPELGSFNNGYKAITSYYRWKLSNTLMQLYPDIGLQLSCFKDTDTISWKTESSRKEYFDRFAAVKQQDPLNPHFWYNITTLDLMRYHRGYHTIIQYYEGRLSNTLMCLYPNIGLQKSRFKDKMIQSWRKPRERKAYFDDYAALKGKDPLDPHFWHSVTTEKLMKYNLGYRTICEYYGGKLSSTLMNIYPNIGLQKSLFKVKIFRNRLAWKNPAKRKEFFDNFAAAKGIDPLNAEAWYNVSIRQLTKYHPGYPKIASYYGGKLSNTLMNIYPNIGLQKSSFFAASWKDMNSRKKLFVDIANEHNFDPLVPDNWYSIAWLSLMNFKGVPSTLQTYYSGTLEKALIDVFPDIGFQPGKFGGGKRILQDERLHLLKVAKKQGFDFLDPNGWISFLYKSKKSDTHENRLTQHMLRKYRHTTEALGTIFPEMRKKLRGIAALKTKCNITRDIQ